ncbi:hypothetical protein [Streptomyces sp. NPDC020681]|uniref:hypothetical protein n=1 Tax=Streptomyces sp. NPDC020681 TaxID=3365083 RepID=UPI0037A8DB12
MCERPAWPGKTIGSSPLRWLEKQSARNSLPRTGAAAWATMAAAWALVYSYRCPACEVRL